MFKRVQGIVIGLLIGAIIAGSTAFARTGSEKIDATYKDIKIYVDGVKIDPRDVNGNPTEPFIYKGTTYLPVRAIGQAMNKNVSWDGATSSVYVGAKPGEKQYLVDVCPAFEFNNHYQECTMQNGRSFQMGGKKYTNGFYADASTNWAGETDDFASYNLDGRYKTITFLAGAVDNQLSMDAEFHIYADGKLIATIETKAGDLPKEYTLNLNNALHLKIEMRSSITGYAVGKIGMAEIVLD